YGSTYGTASRSAGLAAILIRGEGVLEDREHLQRHPFRRIDARGHAVRVRRTTRPPATRILAREQPRDRGLCARVVDLAGRVDRAQHEQHVRLVEERERELAPEVARLARRRIAAALELVREQELDAAAQRALDIARARWLGQRRKAPDEPRVAPGARVVAIDDARRVVLLRFTHEPLDERFESRVPPVSGH